MFTSSSFLYAQYPFETHPRIPYMHYKNWKLIDTTERRSAYMIDVPRFFQKQTTLHILVATYPGADSSVITLFKGNDQFQSFIDPYFIGALFGPAPQDVYIEDINGDGRKDVKIFVRGYGCCGAYNFYARVIYLFQNSNGTFTKTAFTDLAMEYKNKPERDFDGDGNYEIIVQSFQHFGQHNYFLFNLYNYQNGQLVNVNHKVNYPIMVQLLWRENYAVTRQISRKKMKGFEKKLPDDYDKK